MPIALNFDPIHRWRRIETTPPTRTTLYRDMADVKGQAAARRALEIAAVGGHSVLMVGPPGSGKSMLAQRFAGLLRDMSTEKALESAAVASLSGRFSLENWSVRPTGSPHHTASAVALVGGGSPPRPGEISLAHQGCCFSMSCPNLPTRALAIHRQGNSNQALEGQAIDLQCQLDTPAAKFLNTAATRLGWSGRGIHRCLKVARTIADLAGAAQVQTAHVAEAVQYRRALKAVH